MAMHDVEKTTIQSGYQNAKRMRRRRRWMPFYILTVLLLTACIGVSLSMTVFFNVEHIEVGGSAPQYTAAQIVESGKLDVGDNLLRMSTQEIQERIERMQYVESATVEKQYPDTVRIEVKECRAAFSIYFDNGILRTSSSGKIIENSTEAAENLPVVYGYNPSILTPGEHTASSDSVKSEIFLTFSEMMNTELSVPITAIDMSDKYNIVVWFDDRIEFSMGNWNEIPYKITLAEAVITRLGKDKEGYLTMIGSNQCAFRDKSSVAVSSQIATAVTTTTADSETTAAEGETTTLTTTVTTETTAAAE